MLIRHPGGYVTGYAHTRALVTEGEAVRGNQPVGVSDGTGRLEGPHLHFTVRHNGELIDPRDFLRNAVMP
jgi:murein DD-endopeptidase MepM/ murein hydrolase activator NlpD